MNRFGERIILQMPLTRRVAIPAAASLAISPLLAGFVGGSIGNGILHPVRLSPMRLEDAEKMLARTGAIKEKFNVRAQDGVHLERMESPAGFAEWGLGSALSRRLRQPYRSARSCGFLAAPRLQRRDDGFARSR